jgi:hypothetical protein
MAAVEELEEPGEKQHWEEAVVPVLHWSSVGLSEE